MLMILSSQIQPGILGLGRKTAKVQNLWFLLLVTPLHSTTAGRHRCATNDDVQHVFHPFLCDQPFPPGQIKTTALLTPEWSAQTVLFFSRPVLTVPVPDITGVNLCFLLLFFSIGLNKLPILLGATLLPVADVFSSEDLEMSTSFSCPNESETADKGDLKCDSWSQLTFVLKAEGSGVTFMILARCHSISRVQLCGLEKKEKPRLHDSLYTLE